VKEGIWKSRVGKDAYKKDLESCYRSQKDVQTQERKDLLFIQEQKERGSEFLGKPTKEEVY